MKTGIQPSASRSNSSGKKITRMIVFISLLCSALIAFSNPLPITNTATVESKKTIREYFKFPQVLVTREEVKTVTANTVEVLFTTNEAGQVNFVLAKTQNEDLKKEVEKQFYKLSLPKLKQDVVHSVILNFKSL